MDRFTFKAEPESSKTHNNPGDVWLSELLQHSELRSVPIKPRISDLPPQHAEKSDEKKIEEVATTLASQLTAKVSTMKDCTSNRCEPTHLNMFNPKALPHGIVGVQLDFELERGGKNGRTIDETMLVGNESNKPQEDLNRTLNQLVSSGAEDGQFRLKLEAKDSALGSFREMEGTVHVHLLRGLN